MGLAPKVQAQAKDTLKWALSEWDQANRGMSLPEYTEHQFCENQKWYLPAVRMVEVRRHGGVSFLCHAQLGCLTLTSMTQGQCPTVLICCPLCLGPWDP